MRASGDETTIMSRSFLTKKYSHCPLKKRPVQFIKEENFESGPPNGNLEPENLSTKPEDLSCKTLVLSPTVTFVSVKNEPHHQAKNQQPDIPSNYSKINNYSNLNHFLVKSSGGPLEPLNLNTSVSQYHYNTSATPPFPRAVPAQYPPHYIPLNYVHPLQSNLLSSPCYYSSTSPPHLPQAPLSPSSPHCKRENSPLKHAFTPFHIHHSASMRPTSTVLPYYPASSESRPARDPQPGEPSPLSPSSTSSASSFPFFPNRSPPSLCPEDLSSPGSVSSESSSGGGSNSRKSKKRESAPRFLCSFCSKSYSTCSGLSKHEQFHCSANEDAAFKKKFKCKFCEKEYNSLGALKMHIRTHTLPCKCKLCGKAFSRPWLLQGHIRTHTGEKPFSCPHCNRAFADRSNLRAHLQTHSDVKKYSCATCNKTFSRMSLLSKHLESGCPGVSAGMIHFTTNTNVTSCCVQVNN